MTIPAEFRCQINQSVYGTTVDLPLSGEEDYKELGSAFVTLGLSLWVKQRELNEAASASLRERRR